MVTKRICKTLLSIALVFCVSCFAAGCVIYWPQERIAYTFDPADGKCAEGTITLEPAQPASEVRAYLKIYDAYKSGNGGSYGPFLDGVRSVREVRVKNGRYKLCSRSKRTWMRIVTVGAAFTWRFPAADLVFLVDAREPVVIPLGNSAQELQQWADRLLPVPENVVLHVPDNPKKWERSIDRLFTSQRPDFQAVWEHREPGIARSYEPLVSAFNQNILAEFGLKAYKNLLERFPDYECREQVARKMQLLQHPPRAGDEIPENAGEIVALFSDKVVQSD